MRITPMLCTKIAAEACCDPRTVHVVLEGRGGDNARAAVEAAIKRLGLEVQVPSSPSPSTRDESTKASKPE